jgi:hypothetical protein
MTNLIPIKINPHPLSEDFACPVCRTNADAPTLSEEGKPETHADCWSLVNLMTFIAKGRMTYPDYKKLPAEILVRTSGDESAGQV